MAASKDDLPHDLIQDIAGHLDCGNDCYYNPKTNELMFVPHNLHDYYSEADGFWEETLQKIDKESQNFLKFEKPSSFESFRIMERFLNEVDDIVFRSRLIKAISGGKPFRNFKNLIDNSKYRNKWFDFKSKEFEEMVREQFHLQKPADNIG